ncbi:MAG: hypothetical protein UY72_C0062G0010, partial [Candidatus Uhrbacteria bacterium GW2011_GWD2_52_7]
MENEFKIIDGVLHIVYRGELMMLQDVSSIPKTNPRPPKTNELAVVIIDRGTPPFAVPYGGFVAVNLTPHFPDCKRTYYMRAKLENGDEVIVAWDDMGPSRPVSDRWKILSTTEWTTVSDVNQELARVFPTGKEARAFLHSNHHITRRTHAPRGWTGVTVNGLLGWQWGRARYHPIDGSNITSPFVPKAPKNSVDLFVSYPGPDVMEILKESIFSAERMVQVAR